jgi:hypothetical protein
MGTVTVCPPELIAGELEAGLSVMPAVLSVHTLKTERALSVWVGIKPDDAKVREAVYRFEDEIAGRYTDVLFDFHVIPVPAGRKVEDYISNAHPIFQRLVA